MNEAAAVLGLMALGFVVSLMSGFFGVGGGWVVTPALNVFGLAMPYAVGTSFVYVAGVGLAAIIRHRRRGNVRLAVGLVIAFSMIAGIEAGKTAMLAMERRGCADSVVRGIYMFFLFGLGIFMLAHTLLKRNGRTSAEGARDSRRQPRFVGPWLKLDGEERVSAWVPVFMGLAAGVLCGLMGVGGGFVLVPAMIYILRMPTVAAVGTSLVCVAVSGLYGAASYALAGKVEWPKAIWMLAGAMAGIPFGVRATGNIAAARLRLLYAATLLAGGASVALKQFGMARTAMAVVGLFVAALACVILKVAAGGIKQAGGLRHDESKE